MHDKLFKLLKRKWTTPIDALREAGSFSLAQRVSEWRAAGIAIQDKWVESNGKRFKAYRVTEAS
ncbi:MAG TPA: hypothetical protein VD994_19875 [Prosthecobacter sp.]|nr:hypothetical protein [Prosthecobacter sp.]